MRPSKSSLALLAALVLAGCGGSSGASAPSTTATTSTGAKAQPSVDRTSYIARADALCKSSNTRQQALRRQAPKGLPPIKLVPILRQQAKIASGLATELGKLSPPPADRAAVARFVRSVQQLSVFSSAVANSIAAKHGFAARALAGKLGLARQQETLLGQGYGYKTCASGKSY